MFFSHNIVGDYTIIAKNHRITRNVIMKKMYKGNEAFSNIFN